MTYLSSLYPQGPGQLDWRADVEWAGAGVRAASLQMHCSFRPRNGWKFGSCDGWGTLTFTPAVDWQQLEAPLRTETNRRHMLAASRLAGPARDTSVEPVGQVTVVNVYDGQVDGPGAPGPQIHMHAESGTVSTPAPMLRAHGKGKMRYINGDRYDGQWVNSRREGQAQGNRRRARYVRGAWAKDMRNGAGRYIDNAGNVMMGRWENNVPREGVMEWSNGDTYDGWWSGNASGWSAPSRRLMSGRSALQQHCELRQPG